MADSQSIVSSVINGITSGLKNGISKLFSTLFVDNGYVTTTEKPTTTKVKDISEQEDLQTIIGKQWDLFCESCKKAYNNCTNALVAAGKTLKNLFWDNWVDSISNIEKTYNKYWNLLKKQFDPKKYKNYTKELEKKKELLNINLTKFASVIPSYEAIMTIKDLLLEFAEIIGDYQDPYDQNKDPAKAIDALILSISPLVEALKPFNKYSSSFPMPWDILTDVLKILAKNNDNATKDVKKRTSKYRKPEMPPEIANAIKAFSSSVSGLSMKTTFFVIWLIVKCIAIIAKILEEMDITLPPPLNLITSLLKLVEVGFNLITTGPLAVESIGKGIMSKLGSVIDGEAFSSIPESINFTAFGIDIGGIETTETVLAANKETLTDLKAQDTKLTQDILEAKRDTFLYSKGTPKYEEALAKYNSLVELQEDIQSDIKAVETRIEKNNEILTEKREALAADFTAYSEEYKNNVAALNEKNTEIDDQLYQAKIKLENLNAMDDVTANSEYGYGEVEFLKSALESEIYTLTEQQKQIKSLIDTLNTEYKLKDTTTQALMDEFTTNITILPKDDAISEDEQYLQYKAPPTIKSLYENKDDIRLFNEIAYINMQRLNQEDVSDHPGGSSSYKPKKDYADIDVEVDI